MTRLGEQGANAGLLDDSPGVHDGNAIGHLRHDPHVMGDKENAGPGFGTEPLHEEKGICAWIVTSSAVVGSSARRMAGRQASAMAIITPLAHPAGKLEGELPQPALRFRDADRAEQLQRLPARLVPIKLAMCP